MSTSKKRGFSLLEVMVSISVLGAVSYLGFTGIENIKRHKTITRKNLGMENIVYSTLNTIRSNINNQKIHFKSQEILGTGSLEDIREKLPVAWDERRMVSVKECLLNVENEKDCPKGRLGYVVEPMGSIYRGLWKVTLRMAHPDLVKEGFIDYIFFVSGK